MSPDSDSGGGDASTCSRPAAIDLWDASQSGCVFAAADLYCNGPNGAGDYCLSNDPPYCDGLDSTWVCSNLCNDDEYAVACDGPGFGPWDMTLGGCHPPAGIPDGLGGATSCCPCGVVPSAPVPEDASPTSAPPDAAGTTADGGGCPISSSYAWIPTSAADPGASTVITDRFALTGAVYSHTRTWSLPGGVMTSHECTVYLGGVAADDGASPTDICRLESDFGAPDVQSAFAESSDGAILVYGLDTRPAGGSVLVIQRDDGSSFAVGEPCPDAGGAVAACVPIPVGIASLVADLVELDAIELAGDACDRTL